MLDEEAKAVQEVAKAANKALDVSQGLGKFLGDIFGESCRHFGGSIADWACYYRYRNFLKISDKIAAVHANRHLEGKVIPIPPQFSLPLIEGATLESEESLQLLWAGLIANATDPTRMLNMKKVYIEILRGLEPLDAKILELLTDLEIPERYCKDTGACLNVDELARLLGAEVEDVKISLQTLNRYSCVIDFWAVKIDDIDSGLSGFRVNNPESNFRASHLGWQLIQATRAE